MTEVTFIDMLSVNQVWIRKETYVEFNGVQTLIHSWRKSYDNSDTGRNEVNTEVDEPYRTAIFAIWGDEPTVIIEPAV